MSRFDRYILSQLMALFGFFSLVLVSIYWINQAVRLFDSLIGDGQSALVFLEFTALTLPNVIRIVLPMAAFAAVVYVTNRLSSESELVVMQSTGFSPWRLARPVLWFGLIVGLFMSVMTHLLVPVSMTQLQDRQDDLERNVTARLLTEGTFLHPAPGITFYIRSIEPDGTLTDVFLSDRRNPKSPQTFTAARAYLVADRASENGSAKLVMVEGLAQTLRTKSDRLFTTHFQDFTYDIERLFGTAKVPFVHVRYLSTWRLFTDADRVMALTGASRGEVVEEAHVRFAQALLCMAAALIGFSTLLVGGFSRFGIWRQIVLAIVLLLLIKGIEGAAVDPVRKNPALWPLVYLSPLVGFVIGTFMLWLSARPRRLRRRAPEEVAA